MSIDLPKNPSPVEQLNQIVEHGMCIGCGICESIAGAETIKLEMVQNGTERPIVLQPFDQPLLEKIYAVCPGTRINGLPETLISEETKIDSVWGAWQELYFSYSAEPYVRHIASTGGLLTGLALYLVESKTVDFVLHAKASEENPSFGEAFISRSREDILNAAGSRYGPTATLKNIVKTIAEADMKGETFVFIGTPCDVSSLRNYSRLDQRVSKTCLALLTMVCGGFMAPSGLRDFLTDQNIIYDDIVSLRYRGYGCPGPTTIVTKTGETRSFTYLEFWGEDDSAWKLPPRCKICPDGIGDSADIAVSDTWEGGSPTEAQQREHLGSNAAIVRSRVGNKIMNDAINAGYIVRGNNVTPADMNRFQPHQEAKKRSVWARFEGLRQAGNIVPETSGLRIRKLWQENSDQSNLTQTQGTRRRVADGKFSEATPIPINSKIETLN